MPLSVTILLEQSFSEFGTSDIVMLLDGAGFRSVVFGEAKRGPKWTLAQGWEAFLQAVQKPDTARRITSNIFGQLYLRSRLHRLLHAEAVENKGTSHQMMTASPSELKQAIHLARAGQKRQAVALLRQILKQNPNNIQALLWLSGLTPNLHEGIIALERALQLDPGNEAAQRGLAHLRARQSQAQSSDSAGPQSSPSPKPQLSEETTPPPTVKQSITGEELMSLAGSVVWPFKGLKRPLGELLAEGVVQPHDLGWAVRKAFDPTVKWAAAIHLKAKALQAISLPPDKARQVVWPFKNLNRPMGELLAEQVITLHDLAWAVANAYDARVSEAAAVLGAEIVRRTLPATDSPSQETPPVTGEDSGVSPDALEVKEETIPVVEPQTSSDEERRTVEDKLRVVEGSAYLREQEEQKGQQKAFLGCLGIVLLLTAMLCATGAMLLQLVGIIRPPIWPVAAGVGFVGLAWLLVLRVEQLRAEQDNFAAGRRGEEKLVVLLQEHLDGRWTLFRNVLLPDGYGDIDAVLTGPKGIYALEVKAYSGYNRNVGKRWQRRLFGFWRTLDRNPTRQALQNATRLHDHLSRHGVEVWVEPRVVWAGKGKLWLERPAVRVWQLTNPDYIREDIEKGKTISADVLSDVNAVLVTTQP